MSIGKPCTRCLTVGRVGASQGKTQYATNPYCEVCRRERYQETKTGKQVVVSNYSRLRQPIVAAMAWLVDDDGNPNVGGIVKALELMDGLLHSLDELSREVKVRRVSPAAKGERPPATLDELLHTYGMHEKFGQHGEMAEIKLEIEKWYPYYRFPKPVKRTPVSQEEIDRLAAELDKEWNESS